MNYSALILGTLHGQNEAIELLKRKGWTVHSCGLHPEGPGVETADSFHQVDIVDQDAVATLASSLKVTCVYSVGSDIAMPTVAAVSERLGLPYFHDSRITRTLFRKDLFREFLDATGIPTVPWRRLFSVHDLDSFDAYPAVMKPADSQGQRGIRIVNNREEAMSVFSDVHRFSRSQCCIIEQWMEGPEFSVHVFLEHGNIVFSMASDRQVWSGPVVGIAESHRVPSTVVTNDRQPEVRAMIESLIERLGITNGPLYAQMIWTRSGPRFIEVASRLDGCHLWRLMLVQTGVNLLEACFDSLIGQGWKQPEPKRTDQSHILRFSMGSPKEDYSRWELSHPKDPNIIYYEKQVNASGNVRDVNGIVGRIGYHIAQQQS